MGETNAAKSKKSNGPDTRLAQHPLWKPKFIITAFIVLAATGLRTAGLIGSGEWVAVVNMALATFVAGSVIENKLLK